MTLTKQNSGKYLCKEFERTLAKGVKDRTSLSQAEIDWVELGDGEGLGKDNPEAYKQDMYPLDGSTPIGRKKLDVRSRESHGGEK